MLCYELHSLYIVSYWGDRMKRNQLLCGIVASCCMLAIILDGRAAQISVQEGLDLCLKTVIPALFPFFVLSPLLNSTLLGGQFSLFRHLGSFCKMPKGSESILIIGLLSGYPVGAQLISQSYKDGYLDTCSAKRLLGFCNNAGPAFIFGMLGPQFENPAVPWALWGVHVVGSLIAGRFLSGETNSVCQIKGKRTYTLSSSLQQAIRTMASVCGWVIIFRVLFGFCERWFLWCLPNAMQVLFAGILELSNGCVLLRSITTDGLRFVLAGFMLSIGGICVLMQTTSVTQGLGLGYYFPGKVTQAFVSVILCYLLQYVLFSPEHIFVLSPSVLVTMLAIIGIGILFASKKVVAIHRRMLYNTGKHMH